MIKINMLSEDEVRSKLELFDQLKIGIFALVGVIAIIFILAYTINGKIETLMAENIRLQTELNRLTKVGVERKDKEFKKIKRELETKIDIIWDLKSKQAGPVHLLDGVSKSLPDRVWLNSLKEMSRGTVVLKGVAYSNKDVAQFMTNLERSAHFSEIILNRSGQKSMGVHKVMSFSMTMKYNPPKGWSAR